MQTITPERIDFDAVVREHGRPPADAPRERLADLYRLAQAHKLLRIHAVSKLRAEHALRGSM